MVRVKFFLQPLMYAIRFDENDVRPMGRSASGVKGMNVDDSHIIGVTTNN